MYIHWKMEEPYITVLIVLGILTIGYIYYFYDCEEYMKNVKRTRMRPYVVGRCGGCGDIEEGFGIDTYYDNLLPWWNSTRHTRNMSWDIRGDVPQIPYYVGPWMNSPLI